MPGTQASTTQAPSAASAGPRLTGDQATDVFLADRGVAAWVGRYPAKGRVNDAVYSPTYHDWTIRVWWGKAGEIATGRVDDPTGAVTEAWTGPQVAWKMARGYAGAFGGKTINSLPVWLSFCAVFLLGLADLRRPLSVRNLDLLVLLSFSVSLWYFNEGHVFTSVPLVYPPMLYLLARVVWAAWRGPAPGRRPVWPAWLLAAAAVFALGFRIGLNVTDSNVIDVGYSGVIGAERIWSGQSPYGNFPIEGSLKACGPADRDGEIRDRIQTNGRCESANPQGDTYGPVAYETYLPGYLAFGWSGRWDTLPAAHATSIAFDVLAVLALGLVGFRLGGFGSAATLAFAWAAYPFTQYVSSSNTNDAIMPVLLLLGFWLVTRPGARGAFAALAGWTKFAALVVAPLWSGYPEARRLRSVLPFAIGFLVATAAAFSVLLLEPSPLHAARVFYDRTFGWQIGRPSAFSVWDWRQYHAGLPDLHGLQIALEALLGLAAVALAFVPRRRTPLRLAALTAALLIGFELVLTHWFYLYLPWFFPFVAIALLVPARARAGAVADSDDRAARELVAAG